MNIGKITSTRIQNKNFLFLIFLLGTLVLTSFFPVSSTEKCHDVIAVQIFALRDSIPVDNILREYQIDTPVHVRFHNGLFKYWIGPFDNFSKANHYLIRLKNNSKLEEAFVVRCQHEDSLNIDSTSILTSNNNEVVLDSFNKEKIIVKQYSGIIDTGFVKNVDQQSYMGGEIMQRVLTFRSQHILWAIVAYFFLLIFLTITIILFSRTYGQWITKKRHFLRDQCQAEIAEYLFNEQINNIPDKLRLIKKRSRRQLLIDEIIMLKNDLSGEVIELLNHLYRNLDLTRDSLAKLKNRRWDIKAKGFKELSVMEIEEAIPKIEKYSTHRNDILRAEAFLALVKLKKEDPFYFLDSEKITLTRWDQLNLHASIHSSGIEVPEFKRWLNSSNESVILFSLKMISVYKQFDAAQEIAFLLDHSNEKIRKLAIQVVGDMELSEYSGKLSQMYENESYTNKLAIIHSIGHIGNVEEMGLLYTVISTESDFDLRFAGMNALNAMGEEGRKLIDELVDAKSDLADIAKHVFDIRI